jgi:hypothetical protein
MWKIWRINWQTVKISVSCKIFVLTLTYLLFNILHKLLSIIDIISQNCRNLHLYPLTVNVIQTVTQSVQYSSARLLMYCELLYRQRGIKNSVSFTFLNTCACTSNTFCEHRTLWSTIQCKFTECHIAHWIQFWHKSNAVFEKCLK